MANSKLVSIVIPYFNAAKYIDDTIASVREQSCTDWEIVIVNDGSTDLASVRALDKWKENSSIKIYHTDNTGPSSARNFAITHSRGQYILPLDADNMLYPDALEKLLEAIAQHKTDAAYGDFTFFGAKQGLKPQQPLELKIHCVYSQADTCALISKHVFDNGLHYDEYLNKLGLEDWEFWIHFLKTNYTATYIPTPIFKMRVNEESRTYQVANKNLEQIWSYVVGKHADVWRKVCNDYYYEVKMTRETPDYRIGNLLLKPYRFFKNKLFSQ